MPDPIGWVLDQLTGAGTQALGKVAENVADGMFGGFVDAGDWMIRTAFAAADHFSRFDLSRDAGPVGGMWPITTAIAGLLAFTLFLWQLGSAMVRQEPAGLARALKGLVSYALAVAVAVGVVQALNVACDGVAAWILQAGLRKDTLAGAAGGLGLARFESGVAAAALLVVGVLACLAGLLLWVEMVFRQAAVLILVCTTPIAAAGLLADSTNRWFWKTSRWTVAALVSKPAICLAVVIGVKELQDAQGVDGLLGGLAVVVVATAVPFALYRLFSFVETAGGMGVATGALAGAGMVPGRGDDSVQSREAGHGYSSGRESALIGEAAESRALAAAGLLAGAPGPYGAAQAGGGTGMAVRLAPLAGGYRAAARLAAGFADHLASTGAGDGHGAAYRPRPRARTASGPRRPAGGAAPVSGTGLAIADSPEAGETLPELGFTGPGLAEPAAGSGDDDPPPAGGGGLVAL